MVATLCPSQNRQLSSGDRRWKSACCHLLLRRSLLILSKILSALPNNLRSTHEYDFFGTGDNCSLERYSSTCILVEEFLIVSHSDLQRTYWYLII